MLKQVTMQKRKEKKRKASAAIKNFYEYLVRTEL